jgi:hypothetical protein
MSAAMATLSLMSFLFPTMQFKPMGCKLDRFNTAGGGGSGP